jgi:hypothetical protein
LAVEALAAGFLAAAVAFAAGFFAAVVAVFFWVAAM